MSTSPSSASSDEPLSEPAVTPPALSPLGENAAGPAGVIEDFDASALTQADGAADKTADGAPGSSIAEPVSIRTADTLEQRLRDVIAFVSEKFTERGSATEAEEHTAQFVAAELKAMGLAPQQQNFLGLTSAYSPYILASGLALLSLFLFWHLRDARAMSVAALILLGVVIAALIYELWLRDNPLRWWLSPEYSQNVFVHFAASGAAASGAAANDDAAQVVGARSAASPILITTHLDSHRTPMLFSSPGWLRFLRLMPPLGLLSLVALWVLYLAGFITNLEVLRWIALVPGAVVVLIFGLLIQAARSPFSPGANDNASGIAAGLELAALLAASPLHRHEVYLVFTGGGEAGGSGVDAFIRTHLANRDSRPIHLVINRIAGPGAQPTLVDGVRFLSPALSDPGLVQLARQVQPEVQVRRIGPSNSELGVGARHGLRTLGFTALPATPDALARVGDDAAVLHWHQPTDTVANCDLDVAARTLSLIWGTLQAVDGAADHAADASDTTTQVAAEAR